jgi:phage shock protein C
MTDEDRAQDQATGPGEQPGPTEPSPASETGTAVASPPAPAQRKLARSREDRVIAGVCGGLGEYLGVDAVLVRIAALILVFAGGAGIVLYLIGWIAMPEAPGPADVEGGSTVTVEQPRGTVDRRSGAFVLGLVFVALGVFFLADEIWPDFMSWTYIWPVALIAVGIAILLRPRR